MTIFTPDVGRRAMGGQHGASSEEAGAGAGASGRPGGPRGRGWSPGPGGGDLRDLRGQQDSGQQSSAEAG